MTEDPSIPAVAAPDADPGPDMRMAPGGLRAQGCACSVLADAGHRAGVVEDPFVDPRCSMHAH